MNKTKIFLASAAALLASAAACDQDSTIGSSIVQDEIAVVIDSSFTVTGHSIKIDSVQSRTTTQLLGRFKAPGYGFLQSNVVTQFMPSSQIDTTENVVVDSLMLYMYMADGAYVGDSIVPMGLNVYRLNKNLPSPIYSNFDPKGYYSKADLLGSAIYNIAENSADTIIDGAIEIRVPMPKSLAHEFYNAFKQNPSNFYSPSAFADNVFKGVYIENSFGSGRLIASSSTVMTLFYHRTYFDDELEKDTTVYSQGNYFAVTPEIITNNALKFEASEDLLKRINQDKEQLLMAPLGYGVEVEFPVKDIIESYNKSQGDLTLLNTLSFTVPSEGIVNDFGFSQPPYLLMVLTKDMDEFFANNSLPDNVTSFYATYSSSLGGYDFGEMREYLVQLMEKESYDASDYTFTLLPVTATFESSSSYYSSSSTLTMITPYMSVPVMGRLLLDQAKIKLTYSTQTINK